MTSTVTEESKHKNKFAGEETGLTKGRKSAGKIKRVEEKRSLEMVTGESLY